MKLSKRLQQINSMITSKYDHIWDCCCDHGLLGMSLLDNNVKTATQDTNQQATMIHFVDIVVHLMNELHTKLHSHFAKHDRDFWKTHCLDVSTLPLSSFTGKHLIIIAGVGGDQTIQFVNNICNNNPDLTLDFLLCPVHQLYRVRKQLIKLNIELESELLIEENNRFYELLLVSRTPIKDDKIHKISNLVSPIGTHIWQCDDKSSLSTAQSYLSKTLEHYERMLQGPNNKEIAIILDEYHKIKQTLDAQALQISRSH